MKKLLVLIFVLSIPIVSNALTCPNVNGLNNFLDSGGALGPGVYLPSHEGFSTKWMFTESKVMKKGDKIIRFTSVTIPTKQDRDASLACRYDAKISGESYPISFRNKDKGPFKGTKGDWSKIPATKGLCYAGDATGCGFDTGSLEELT